jgi:hypothetical protein
MTVEEKAQAMRAELQASVDQNKRDIVTEIAKPSVHLPMIKRLVEQCEHLQIRIDLLTFLLGERAAPDVFTADHLRVLRAVEMTHRARNLAHQLSPE